MKFLLPLLIVSSAISAQAAYVLNNGDFAGNSLTGWTTTGTVSAATGAAVMSASSSISQDFSGGPGTATEENYNFQLDLLFRVSASNLNQRIRIRDNANAGDIITLRLNSGNGIQAFSGGVWQNALTFTVATNTSYFLRVTGSNLDLGTRSFTVALSSDGVNYTSSSSLSLFHSALVGSDFETLVLESGASTTLTADNISVVPEPAATFLGALGFLALLRRRRN